MTASELRQVQLMDRLSDWRPVNPGEIADISEFLDDQELSDPHTQELWRGTLRVLRDQGLVNLAEVMAFEGTGVGLTGAGRVWVESLRARRADPVRRNRAIRDLIVRFLYAQPDHAAISLEPMCDDSAYFYEGQTLTIGELNRQGKYLMEAGLITAILAFGNPSPCLRPSLTSQGIECVEEFGGSVSQYRNRAHPGGSHTHNNLTIGGNVSGNVAMDAQGLTQMVRTDGMPINDLTALVQRILDTVDTLGLDRAQADRVRGQAAKLADELQEDDQDPGTVKKILNRILPVLAVAANTAEALGLGTAIKEAITALS